MRIISLHIQIIRLLRKANKIHLIFILLSLKSRQLSYPPRLKITGHQHKHKVALMTTSTDLHLTPNSLELGYSASAQVISLLWGRPGQYRIFSSFPNFYPLETSNNLQKCLQRSNAPREAKWPPVENHNYGSSTMATLNSFGIKLTERSSIFSVTLLMTQPHQCNMERSTSIGNLDSQQA